MPVMNKYSIYHNHPEDGEKIYYKGLPFSQCLQVYEDVLSLQSLGYWEDYTFYIRSDKLS